MTTHTPSTVEVQAMPLILLCALKACYRENIAFFYIYPLNRRPEPTTGQQTVTKSKMSCSRMESNHDSINPQSFYLISEKCQVSMILVFTSVPPWTVSSIMSQPFPSILLPTADVRPLWSRNGWVVCNRIEV
jgi:hypothetical protein